MVKFVEPRGVAVGGRAAADQVIVVGPIVEPGGAVTADENVVAGSLESTSSPAPPITISWTAPANTVTFGPLAVVNNRTDRPVRLS